ncbi:hypothetical protein [Rickettsiella massiliensis]|uniref:hypothetical protein n=1 Tax=Rickettsiella massiliensis TaxID=676517 RepID=UPI00029AA3EE|nr:hypothetical protein [Rickettsiella massiliensis]
MRIGSVTLLGHIAVCAANSPQESEAPSSLQAVASVNTDFSHIGTFHERSLQSPQRMTERVISKLVLLLETNEEKSVPVSEPIYSAINELTSGRSAMAKENIVTHSTLKIKRMYLKRAIWICVRRKKEVQYRYLLRYCMPFHKNNLSQS